MGAVTLSIQAATKFSLAPASGCHRVWGLMNPVAQTEIEHREEDIFNIETHPTGLSFHGSNQNDVWHEDVTGDITYICHPSFEQGIKYGGNTYLKDVLIVVDGAGMEIDSEPQVRSGRLTYDHLRITSYNVTSTTIKVGYKITGYYQKNGSWVVSGNATGTATLSRITAQVSGIVTDIPTPNPKDWALFGEFERLRLNELIDEKVTFGELSLKAAETKRLLNINTMMYFKDLFELPKLVEGLVGRKAIKALSDFRFSTATASSLKKFVQQIGSEYLGHHYGTKLTLLDTQTIARAIDSVNPWADEETLGSSRAFELDRLPWRLTTGSGMRKCTAVVDAWSNGQLHACDSVRDAIHQLGSNVARWGYELDVVPSLSNLWDMIPYSFVADWVLPIGDSLEFLESKHHLESFRPRIIWYSQKWEFDERSDESTANWTKTASLKHRCYERRCRTEFIEPRPRLESPLTDGFNHWVEAAALLVQAL